MMSKSLKLPDGELAMLAELRRQEQLKRKLADLPTPFFKGGPRIGAPQM